MMAKRHAKSSLFLLEMMVVILFFALTSAICVHLFVQAHQTARHSEALTNGVLLAQSAAELYKSTAGDLGETAKLLEGQWDEAQGLSVAYDALWQPVGPQTEAAYRLEMTETADQRVRSAEINIVDASGQAIYQLHVKAYQAGGERL